MKIIKKFALAMMAFVFLCFAPALSSKTNADSSLQYRGEENIHYSNSDIWVDGEAWSENNPNRSVGSVYFTTAGYTNIRWDNVAINPAGGAKTPRKKISVL